MQSLTVIHIIIYYAILSLNSLLSRKKDILTGIFELKGKEEIIVFCDLSPVQRKLYEYILSLPDFDNAKNSNKVCNCKDSDGSLRKYCCMKFIVPYRRDGSEVIDPRAVVWRKQHPGNKLCGKQSEQNKKKTGCPNCVTLPCIRLYKYRLWYDINYHHH